MPTAAGATCTWPLTSSMSLLVQLHLQALNIVLIYLSTEVKVWQSICRNPRTNITTIPVVLLPRCLLYCTGASPLHQWQDGVWQSVPYTVPCATLQLSHTHRHTLKIVSDWTWSSIINDGCTPMISCIFEPCDGRVGWSLYHAHVLFAGVQHHDFVPLLGLVMLGEC